MQQDQPKDSQEESKPREEELINLGPSVMCKNGHTFEVIGMEFGMQKAQCKGCPMGYYLPFGTTLKGGHIYEGKKLVI